MRGRHRDRHGRGIRGPLAPAEVPVHRSRSEQFDELVLDAVERLERRWAAELRDVELAVEDVPPPGQTAEGADAVPLGRSFPATGAHPARIVVYRRPVESRAHDQRTRGLLVHEVVVEQVAALLGLPTDVVDPGSGGGEAPE